jgi:hypothetical protein
MMGTFYGNRLPRGTQVEKKKFGNLCFRIFSVPFLISFPSQEIGTQLTHMFLLHDHKFRFPVAC